MISYPLDSQWFMLSYYRTVVSYQTTQLPLLSLKSVSGADNLALYDSVDEDVITSYNEFALASLIYASMKEGAASEQSARMTAMEGASKNAGKCLLSFAATSTKLYGFTFLISLYDDIEWEYNSKLLSLNV